VTQTLSFAFKAVRRDGAAEAGVIDAPSREAAVALLARRGAFATELSTPVASRASRASMEDLALGMRALATLLGAGIPLARALGMLDELAPPSWRPALPELRQRVDQGEPLAAVLGASPLPFSADVIGIVQAGEAGSGLAAAAECAAQLLEQRAASRAAIRSALAYPTMLAVAGSASVALLVGVVLPRFAGLLSDYGQTLPLTTRLVLTVGAVAKLALLPSLLLVAVAVVAWQRRLARTDQLSRWHRWLLTVPGVGPIRRATGTANACAALAALLDAGVALPAALPHAARASGDRALEESLLRARDRIIAGARISAALLEEKAVTPSTVRLVRIGEETGKLGSMLAHAARIEAAHALQRLQRLTKAIEPALILLFGGVVMIVATALLQAMYGLRPGH
jgi:general secretion pathway protein F